MITVEDLKAKFGVRHHPQHGPCIVIPKGKFNAEWENPLRSEGVNIKYNVDLPNSENCTILKLKPEHLGEKTVYSPAQPTAPWMDPERQWTQQEDELLIKLWNQKLKVRQMIPYFPKRSPDAVRLRLNRLKKAGKIPWAFKKKSRKEADTATPITPESEEKGTVKLLKEIRDLLQEESVYFESYCPTCRDRRSVQDSNVWKCCPICGGPLIIWNVEASS